MICKQNSLLSKKFRNNPEKIVLVGGCFDLLHYGHISFLTEAKKLGGRLVVLLESDENVKKLKGDGRPFHTQAQRKEMLETLSVVDEVIPLPPLSGNDKYLRIVQDIHPTIIAMTDGERILKHRIKQAKLVGAKPVIIPKIPTPSTTKLAKLLRLE